MSDARRAVAVDRGRSEGEAVTDARRAAEEALEHYATCPGEGRWRECSSSLASALRALLAEQPEAGAKEDDILIVDHGHRAFVTCGEEHAPAPSPARDEVREALREVADSGVEFNDERVGYVTVQIDRETWETVRRLAALSRDAKGGAE